MKTIVITGGTKGIGSDIARKYLSEGWDVLIGARQETGLALEKQERLKFQKIDVKNESDHYVLVKTMLDWRGSLDCFINCAGFSKWSPVQSVTDEFWNKMIDTNLKGTFWGCKVAAGHLSEGGSIVNVSSLAGKRGSANNSVYCASKFGTNGLTQALAKELGPKSIRVNAVCPVYVETTALLEALVDQAAPPRGEDPLKYLADFVNSNSSLQRLPLGSEIADLCFYLSSSAASAVTGQCINIDCGVLPQ